MIADDRGLLIADRRSQIAKRSCDRLRFCDRQRKYIYKQCGRWVWTKLEPKSMEYIEHTPDANMAAPSLGPRVALREREASLDSVF